MSKIPSIALIPSGYKEGKLYSQLPINGDGDLTFARTGTSGVPNATRVNEQGLIEDVNADVPRLDYSDGGCPSLLLEPTSTNLVEYSQDFSDSSWSAFDVTSVPNSVTDPSGNLTATRITALSGTNRAMQKVLSITADPLNDRTYTGSFYIKSPNTTSCSIRVGGASSNTSLTISSEWQRFDAQYVLNAGSTVIRLGVILVNENDILDVAFGQVEEQLYATSYIPTNASIETRTIDTVSKTGLSNYFNSSEGVLYLEMAALADDGTNRILGFGDNLAFNDSLLIRYSSTSNRITVQSRVSGVYTVQINYDLADTTNFSKIAFKYKENDFALWVDGVEVGTDNSGTLPSSINSIFQVPSNEFHGEIKDLRVYDTALTDQELTDLTS